MLDRLPRRLFAALALLLVPLVAQTPSAAPDAGPLVGPIEYLWPAATYPNGAPLAVGNDAIDRPNLSLYLAPGDGSKPAIVVCPGGGYGGLAKAHEGHAVAEFCRAHGIHAFVLTYRHAPRYRYPAPLLDVQRAVRTVRSRAAEWGVDPDRIGVMGFSAGGHLCSMAATMGEPGVADAEDPIERVSSRPDFAALIYPVIALDKPYTHQGSRRNLLGDNQGDAELVAKLSTASAVTKDTAPCFLMHTTADKAVPPENSIEFYLALRRVEVPAALQLFEKGQHGVGLGRPGTAVAAWPELFVAWLGERGVLAK